MKRIAIALVGDFNEKMYTHVALNQAIDHCRQFLDFELDAIWVPTDNLNETLFHQNKFQGCWITPGSPYKNDEAVYDVIRWARENNFPIFGTCGGFQYMVVEYARTVLGLTGADHEESNPGAEKLIVSKLSCSLKGQEEEVLIKDKQCWLYRVLQTDKIVGRFNCSYGVNPVYQPSLEKYPFAFTAFSATGEARGLEIKTHRFFNGVLFQPPLESTPEQPSPLLLSFFNICANEN